MLKRGFDASRKDGKKKKGRACLLASVLKNVDRLMPQPSRRTRSQQELTRRLTGIGSSAEEYVLVLA